jgi:TetR/AcrR family tetracycline transcriptional repressor
LSDRQIVQAAQALILEVGVEGLTMRRLSAELGVALGATYHYVPTKRALLLLLARELYREVVVPDKGAWDQRVRALMINLAHVVGRYPGMASFMNANLDETTPVELNRALIAVLQEAGFNRRGVNAVLSALFFYVAGMCSGGLNASASKDLVGVDVNRLFEDGLDILIAGARASLEENRKYTGRRRPG